MARKKKNRCKSGHKLYPADWVTDYHCQGCKMSGCGPAHGCKTCGYYLHPECINYSTTNSLESCEGHFKFFERPPLGKEEEKKKCKGKKCCLDHRRHCNACSLPVEGFVFYCKETDVYLHPLCASTKKASSSVPAAENVHLAVKLVPSKEPEYPKEDKSAAPSAIGTTAAKNVDEGSQTLQGHSKKKKKPGRGRTFTIFRTIISAVVSVLIGDPTTLVANVAVEALMQVLKN